MYTLVALSINYKTLFRSFNSKDFWLSTLFWSFNSKYFWLSTLFLGVSSVLSIEFWIIDFQKFFY